MSTTSAPQNTGSRSVSLSTWLKGVIWQAKGKVSNNKGQFTPAVDTEDQGESVDLGTELKCEGHFVG